MMDVIKRNKLVLVFTCIISLTFLYQTSLSTSAHNVYELTLTGNVFYIKIVMPFTESQGTFKLIIPNWAFLIFLFDCIITVIKNLVGKVVKTS